MLSQASLWQAPRQCRDYWKECCVRALVPAPATPKFLLQEAETTLRAGPQLPHLERRGYTRSFIEKNLYTCFQRGLLKYYPRN